MIKWVRKNYDRLIDIAFWITLVMSLIALSRNFGWHSFITTGTVAVFSITFQLFMWLSLIALVTVRPLRDEYAEKLWHRAAIGFVYIVILIPPIIMILVASFQTPIEAMLGGVEADIVMGGKHKYSPATQQFTGIIKMIMVMAMEAPLIFAGLYKWQRWRDTA